MDQYVWGRLDEHLVIEAFLFQANLVSNNDWYMQEFWREYESTAKKLVLWVLACTSNMPKLNRRNPFQHKHDKVVKIPKTSRTEMTTVQRAFLVGAIVASRYGYAFAHALSARMPHTRQGLPQLLQRVEKKLEEGSHNLWDEILYKNGLGRRRSTLLSQEQDAIINIVTSSRNNREKESWQAVKDGDFDDIIPKMRITTFENVMYEAGYARRRPGWKPPLTL